MSKDNSQDGVYSMVPREKMCQSAQKLRDTYAKKPDAPFYKCEFGYNSRGGLSECYYCLEKWYEQGLSKDADLAELFDYDPQGNFCLGQLGGCEAEFMPRFEDKVIEDRGRHEVIQDFAGRHLLVFKGRRSGFMPEYIDHPVKDIKTWEQNVKWRLDPKTPQRYTDLPERMAKARAEAAKGKIITQDHVGAYMHLRSLIGPENLLYAFYDSPDLIHECMKAWFELSDHVIAGHQQYVTFDEIFFDEDICYKNGPLISPDMIREFLFPYYQQLISNIKSRQLDKTRHLYVQVDTDGFAVPVIELYQKQIGMDVMSPFEVAAGCDVVEIAQQYPDLIMTGGIDKRILAEGKDAIDKHLEYILPAMRRRGGYFPTCDHGVPEEVSLDNYIYYRKRAVELGS
jgi:uroporphyrinogen decarboxylase